MHGHCLAVCDDSGLHTCGAMDMCLVVCMNMPHKATMSRLTETKNRCSRHSECLSEGAVAG